MFFHSFSLPSLWTDAQLYGDCPVFCLIPCLAVPEEVHMAVRHQQQPDVFIW